MMALGRRTLSGRIARLAAIAARYVYEICDSALPGGGLGGAHNSLTPNEPWSDAQNCATPGGSFGITLTGPLPEHGGGKGGAFAAAYHFTSTTQKTTYRFRAVVPEQAGYPWMQGHSKPVPVTVSR